MSDSEEDENERKKKERKEEEKARLEAKTLRIPAGVDLGTFIEETLRRMPEQPVGPKQIIPSLMQKKTDDF